MVGDRRFHRYKINSLQITKGDKVTLKANPDNVKDFYETGMSYINNVSVAGGGEKGGLPFELFLLIRLVLYLDLTIINTLFLSMRV